MVHNGIEYGLMAAYAEGLNVLHHANEGKAERAADAETSPLRNPEHYQYDFNIAEISELDLTAIAFAEHPQLEGYSGRVSDSGEGRWTVNAAVEQGVPVPVLSAALFQRFDSQGQAEFANKVLSAMRFQFGGHVEHKAK
jgi:6-phosphogluconate dehydrogenase